MNDHSLRGPGARVTWIIVPIVAVAMWASGCSSQQPVSTAAAPNGPMMAAPDVPAGQVHVTAPALPANLPPDQAARMAQQMQSAQATANTFRAEAMMRRQKH